MCLCSVNKDAYQIHSNMICAFASVQNTIFFFWLAAKAASHILGPFSDTERYF